MGSGVVLGGMVIEAPAGDVTNWHDSPALHSPFAVARKAAVTQFVLHRGTETRSNSPLATKRALEAHGRNLSSLFTLTPDGRIYQHFDPSEFRGRHATHHNVQSDSMDVQGPLSRKAPGADGQTLLPLTVAIGLAPGKDGRQRDRAAVAHGAAAQREAVLTRRMVGIRQWSLTAAQADTIRIFLPWWCQLRGIPLRACSEYRTFRVGGLGVADPVTAVTGILAHGQCAGPGMRADGFVELEALRTGPRGSGIEWRPGAEFWS